MLGILISVMTRDENMVSMGTCLQKHIPTSCPQTDGMLDPEVSTLLMLTMGSKTPGTCKWPQPRQLHLLGTVGHECGVWSRRGHR